jgi:hypothetical protein
MRAVLPRLVDFFNIVRCFADFSVFLSRNVMP